MRARARMIHNTGKKVFITDLAYKDLPSQGVDVHAELRKAEDLHEEIRAFALQQEARRAELDEYVKSLLARRDDSGDAALISLPINYEEVVANMPPSSDAPLSARSEAATDLSSMFVYDVDNESADAAALAAAEARVADPRDAAIADGMALIKQLDARLAKVQREARALAAERTASVSGSVAGDDDGASSAAGLESVAGTSDKSELLAQGAAILEARRKRREKENEATPNFVRVNAAYARFARLAALSEEEEALVARVLARSDEEEALVAAAGSLSAADAARVAEIDEQLRACAPASDWQRLGLDCSTSAVQPHAHAVEAFSAAASKRDYLRMQRINREQRDQARYVERRLRELSIAESTPADPAIVRALLLEALAENPDLAAAGLESVTVAELDVLAPGPLLRSRAGMTVLASLSDAPAELLQE